MAAGPCRGAHEAHFMTLNKALLGIGLPRSWASACKSKEVVTEGRRWSQVYLGETGCD